jgi:hypothetical protein
VGRKAIRTEDQAMAKKKPNARASHSRPRRLRPPKPELFDWRKFDPSMVRGTHADVQTMNMLTYRDNLDELLRDEGKYVLIVGGKIIGIYADKDEAEREVMARFADQHVFIKKIAAKEPMISMGGVVL